MKILGVNMSVKEIIITGFVTSAIFFGLRNTLNIIAPDLAEKVDVTNANNVVNRFFIDKIYKPLTGSEDDLGTDIADGVENVTGFVESLYTDPFDNPSVLTNNNAYDIDYGKPNDGRGILGNDEIFL